MNTFSLAARNLFRNRRRSLMTLLAMIVAIGTVLLFGGYIRDVIYGLETGYVRSGGHLQIQRKGYLIYGAGNPSEYGISNYQRVIDAIREDPVLSNMTTAVTPILQLGGVAGNFSAGASRTVAVTGVVVAEQNRISEWNGHNFPIKPHILALTGTEPDAAVIGTGVARFLQLCAQLEVRDCPEPEEKVTPAAQDLPDDISHLSTLERTSHAGNSAPTHIELLAATPHGAPNVASIKVIKAERQGIKELDDVYLMLHLEQAQRLIYGEDRPQATAVVVQLHRTGQLREAKARIKYLINSAFKSERLEVHEFTVLNPFYQQAIDMFATIFGLIAALIGAIVLFSVSSTMSTAIVERTVEIGTLRAIGLRRKGIRRMFICEGLLLGFIGSGLGISAALVIASLVNHSGFSWTPPGWAQPTPLTIRIWGEHTLIVASALALTFVATLSAWWPALKAARTNIVDALRHV